MILSSPPPCAYDMTALQSNIDNSQLACKPDDYQQPYGYVGGYI